MSGDISALAQLGSPAYVYNSVKVTFFGERDPAELARDATHPHNLRMLFDRLKAARSLMADGAPHGPYRAAFEALHTFVKFLAANPHNDNDEFSIPLELLLAELRVAGPPPEDRNVLHSWEKGQTAERNRRGHMNYLKAAAAYAADRLNANGGMKLDHAACVDVASLLEAYNFPKTTAAQNRPGGLAVAIGRWRHQCLQAAEDDKNPIVYCFRRFPHFQISPNGQHLRSASNKQLLDWLQSELEKAGLCKSTAAKKKTGQRART